MKTDGKPMIEVDRLVRKFGERAVLNDISFNVHRGDTLVIMGGSGCGKSTLARVLTGLIPQSIPAAVEGEVQIAGLGALNCTTAVLARHVGAVFQNPRTHLFHLRVEDEIAFGPRNLGLPEEEIRARVEWSLEALGIAALRGQSPANLSGGQIQRVAIASALAMRPQVLVLGLVLFLVPAVVLKGKTGMTVRARWFLPYFACLGIGFMFVETALIQKIILPLEHPSYAMATVLASLLISSGAGSLASQRCKALHSPAVAAVIAFLVVIGTLAIPAVSDALAGKALPAKVIIVFLELTPLGLLMGIPFPTGLQRLGAHAPLLIPWAWVINGSLSVLAPVLAIMLAMAFGFNAVLYLGALAYLLAFLSLRAVTRNEV